MMLRKRVNPATRGRVGSLAVGLSVVVTVVICGGVVSAASPSIRMTEVRWQQSIAELPAPGGGCYHASYPALHWHMARCEVAPDWPMAPGPITPQAVGDGNDYVAKVSGTISQATGSFPMVSPHITETGQVDGIGPQVANAFSLQLNTETFLTPTCYGSSDPSTCYGWQQFVYSSDPNLVFMQYWRRIQGIHAPPRLTAKAVANQEVRDVCAVQCR